MGLSSYGKADKYYNEFKRVIRLLPDGEYEIDMSFFNYQYGEIPYYSDKFLLTFGDDRKPGQDVTDRHAEVARGGQRRLEDAMLHLANYLHTVTGSRNLCLNGGVALNCVANGRLLKQTQFEQIYVQPAAYDAGAAVGAAFYIHNGLLGNKRDFVMDHAFWGPEYSHDEIEAFLKLSKVPYRKVKNPSAEAARLLAKGRIVGWFQGRMEFGPRALGKRSILADARDPKMKDVVNDVVKHRESFRPFAPSILAEKVSEYFDFSYPSPFMLLVYNVLPDKRDVIPSVTHVDGTGRVHTVEKATDPLYYNLIAEFEKLTGVPVVLNTSFNVQEEPIVCTPNDALRCFYTTGIDDLVIGNFLLSKTRDRQG
jgi:carbamoyltransferase